MRRKTNPIIRVTIAKCRVAREDSPADYDIVDGQAWLDLARGAATPSTDLYRGRLHEVSRPALVILAALPGAQLSFHADACHCPHSESSGAAVSVVAKDGSGGT
jgi:hypothetical protein